MQQNIFKNVIIQLSNPRWGLSAFFVLLKGKSEFDDDMDIYSTQKTDNFRLFNCTKCLGSILVSLIWQRIDRQRELNLNQCNMCCL